jgi:hypothetical protein
MCQTLSKRLKIPQLNYPYFSSLLWDAWCSYDLNLLHRKDGNPFNTSIAPSAQPPAARTPLPAPSTGHVPSKEPAHSSNSPGGSSPVPASGKNKVSTVKLVGYILIGVVAAVIVVLMTMYCLSKNKERKSRDDIYSKGQMGRVPQKLGEPKIKEMTEINEPSVKFKNNVSKGFNSLSWHLIFCHLSDLFPLVLTSEELISSIKFCIWCNGGAEVEFANRRWITL